MVICAILALRGSLRAHLIWLDSFRFVLALRGRARPAEWHDATERRRHGPANESGSRPRLGVLPAGDHRRGILLLKRRSLAYALAPAFMVFLILTGMPILITPHVQAARGEPTGWVVTVPFGVLTVAMLGMLTWLLSTVLADERTGGGLAQPG